MGVDPRTKTEWRAAVLAARAATSPARRAEEAAAMRDHLLATVLPGTTVCAYVPVGSEPGSVAALDALVTANVRVLLPIARDVDGIPHPLWWGSYRIGGLVPAPFGLLEPDGDPLPPEAIAIATTVFVPALAVDHRGARLGRGAGFYDRSLGLADPAAVLVAVVGDDELVEELPRDAHDVPMTHALTPGRGLVGLRHSGSGRE